MHHLLRNAAAVGLVSSASLANGTETYSTLDSELDALAATVSAQGDAPWDMQVLLRTALVMTSDDAYTGGTDVTGFRLQDAILSLHSTIGSYGLHISADAADSTSFPPIAGDGVHDFVLRDAYATGTCGSSGLSWAFGQFKCPAVMSSTVGEGSLMMIDRTRPGQIFDAWQPGAVLMGDWNQIHAKLAVQNGADGIADEVGMVARAEWRVNDGAKQREGAYGAEGTDATIGVAYFKDGSQVGGNDLGSTFVVDGYLTMNALSVHAEVLGMDEELAAMAVGNTGGDDAMPYSATVGYMLSPDTWEAALRYEDLDNDLNQTQITAGLTRYVAGHKAKWQLNVTQYDDDNDDGLLIQLGLTVGQL